MIGKMSVIMLNVDNFRFVNQKFGYPTGDAILRGITNLLMEGIRKQDILARYGDDTFAILLPETKSEASLVIAERVRSKIADNEFFINSEHSLRITISIGIASISESLSSVMTLLKEVDRNLYEAKQAGKNVIKTH